MYGNLTEYAVLWTNSLGLIWDMYDVTSLSLIVKSTFKKKFLVEYVLRVGFFWII